MDELKLRAGEKFEAIQEAAKTAAGSSKSKVQDVVNQTVEAVKKVREMFLELWHHELMTESRARISAWWAEALRRVKEGAPPLSPLLLYDELVTLFKDRVWRRSACIFALGLAVGAVAGGAVGARLAGGGGGQPHARAIHTHADQSVILVEDAVTPGAGTGEVLIRVQSFSVCPVDRWVLRGRGSALRSLIFRTHLTVGRAFAGVVLDVGHGVSELELGDEVWGCVSEWSGGAASELLTVRSTRVSKRPHSLSADAAASLPWAGTLALQAIDQLKYNQEVCKGKRVAICGASSGEGCVLVQLLSCWGAHLTVAAHRHAALTLKDLGAHEFVDIEEMDAGGVWAALVRRARGVGGGPWHSVIACSGTQGSEPPSDTTQLLKATAPKNSIIDLRPRPLISDRLPAPLALLFATSFYAVRTVRWIFGLGTHTDWLEDKHRLSPGLEMLRQLVESGQLNPVLDKVYMPQDFESALAHACSDDAIGTTVIRFP